MGYRMEIGKKIFIILLSLIVIIYLISTFNIIEKLVYRVYEAHYNKISKVENTLKYDFNTSKLEENELNFDNFTISLNDLNYDSNKLSFIIKFSNDKKLNDIGYLLRIYINEYSLSDRFIGKTTLSNQDYIMYQNLFYKQVFNFSFGEKNLFTNFANDEKIMEDGTIIHNLSFDLPNEFVVNNNLNIDLFDINYQNIGDEKFYKPKDKFTEINYNIICENK